MRSTTPARLAACRGARDGFLPSSATPLFQQVACVFDSATPEHSQVIAELQALCRLLEGATECRLLRVAVL